MCTNDQTISRAEVERRVLDGLRHRLIEPRHLDVFISEFRAELNRAAAEASGASAELRGELVEVERKIGGIMKAIEDGMYMPAMKDRMAELEGRKGELVEALAATPENTVRIHPGIERIYRAEIDRIAEALGNGEERELAAEALRRLVSRVVLTPRDGSGLDLELSGPLASILALAEAASGLNAGGSARKQKRPSSGPEGRQLSVVAGAGNHLYRTKVRWP